MLCNPTWNNADITWAELDVTWAELDVCPSGIDSLPARLRIVTPSFDRCPGRINITPYENLFASIEIPYGSNVSGSVSVYRGITGLINIVPYDDLEASVNVLSGDQQVNGKITILQQSCSGETCNPIWDDMDYTWDELDTSWEDLCAEAAQGDCPGDLWGSITVEEIGDNLPATIDIMNEVLKAKVGIQAGDQLLKSSIYVHSHSARSLFGSIDVNVSNQTIGGYIDLAANGTNDVVSTIDTVANRPLTPVNITAYVMPSGYPPLPSGWVDPSGLPVAPSGAVIVPSGVWQNEEEFLFIWDEPDWGYDSTSGTYYVAWNNDPSHAVTKGDIHVITRYFGTTWYDEGDLYFHVKPKNSHGWLGPQSTYNIKINRLPYAPEPPFLVDDSVNPTIHNVTPEFSWGNAEDPDQLDPMEYHVLVATDVLFNDIVKDWNDITEPGNSDRTAYTPNYSDRFTETGQYFWKVRATDGRQYGPWSPINSFIIETVNEDFGAVINVCNREVDRLGAEIDIVGHEELNGNVNIFVEASGNINGSITVDKQFDAEIYGRLSIVSRVELGVSIDIIPYDDLRGSVGIFDTYRTNDLSALVEINEYSDYEVGATIETNKGSSNDFPCEIRLISNEDKRASIVVYDTDNYSFIDDFRTDFGGKVTIVKSGNSDFNASLDVNSTTPGPVTVVCNVEEATWQTNNNIVFTWYQVSSPFFELDGYYTQLDRVSDTVANDSFQRTVGLTRSFDLEDYSGAGVYYFHIAAKSEIGEWGPTTHYEVRYNHKPSSPTVPMTVNDLDCYTEIPNITSTEDVVFEWGQSYDEDTLDPLEYMLQIATQEDFGFDINGNSTILYVLDGIDFYRHTVDSSVFTERCRYYWRVKTFDGHQYSDDWGPTGRFFINTPPTAPRDLRVYGA
jgi:hypothetical protein